MSEQKSKYIREAEALIAKHRKAFDAIQQSTRDYEEKYWNDNKESLQAQGYSYTKDPKSPWGVRWSKRTPSAPVSTPVSTQESVKPTLASRADDKSGNNYSAKYSETTKANQQAAKANQESAVVNSENQQVTSTEHVQKTPRLTVDDYRNSKYFRNVHGMVDGATVTIDGKKYPIFVIQNRYNGLGKSKEENDHTYAVDPETGKMRRVFENWLGIPHNAWSTDEGGEDWFYPSFMVGPEYEWLKANPMPPMRGSLGGGLTPEYEKWLQDYKAAKAVGFKKQGGIMNKVKYFQQGGSMNAQKVLQKLAQGIQNQDPQAIQALQDLATKAANGDEQSVQFLTGVRSLAEKGDQAATIIMDAINQMASAQQAPSAKWGSKLRYIRSLKYAKGGVACPACQAGAAVPTPQDKAYKKPIQKVEEKACGGKAKKAKKRYFGGWL